MSVDWNKAPDWADKLMLSEYGDVFWCNDEKYVMSNRPAAVRLFSSIESECAHSLDSFKLVETRPDAWKEGEKRMDNIGQNGNDGHYEELDNLEKQPRYTDEDDQDWIDEFAANNSIDDFRAAMRFTIGKYERRLGKKDELSKELYKMSDYYQRWSKVEKELEK